MQETTVIERTLTFDEALELAILLQRTGNLDQAETLFGKLQEAAPDHPRVLHYAGVLAHQRDRTDEAIALLQRSLALEPDQPDGYTNLGIMLRAAGRLDEARAVYERAITINPRHANAYNNLGVLLNAGERTTEAEAAYRKAIDIDPEYVEPYHNLRLLLDRLGRRREAALCYHKVITLCPDHPEAQPYLASAYTSLGEMDKAHRIYEQYLRKEPGNPVLAHMLAACTGTAAPARASDACVEALFDAMSATFERTLAALGYRAPRLVAAMVERSAGAPAKRLDVLDAGCGTGLCGPLVAPWARRLVGVDLSNRMLERAREKRVYDQLVKAELTEFLQRHPAAFDLVISADTLVYFGVLHDVLPAAGGALRPGGLVVFTLEELAGDTAGDFRLEPHGRYSHSRPYVEEQLRAAGLAAEIDRAELRMEDALPVAGLVVRARKADRVSDRWTPGHPAGAGDRGRC